MVHSATVMVADSDIEAFLATLQSDRTRAAYRRDLVQLQEFTPAASTAEHIDFGEYQRWLVGAGYRPATVRRRLAAAAQFLRWRDGAPVTVPKVAEPTVSSTPLHGLDDITALIGAVSGPDAVREGVASLLFASKVATVDGLLALGPEHLGSGLRITIDGVEVRFPRSMRGTLELLLREADGGPLFGGMSRQTLTRRLRTFAHGCGVDDCTPRSLRRSSGQITVEAVALLTGAVVDPGRVPPAERLGLITDAVRNRLA